MLTLIIGYPLQLFSPWIAFAIWEIIHFLATVLIVLFLWKKFPRHEYLYLALSLYLLNSYHYYEIQHAQYHFLLSLFTVLFIYVISKTNRKTFGGILYFLSLLVKPIGFLWLLPLLIYRKWKIISLGIFLYLITLVPFILNSTGKYFCANLYDASTNLSPSYNLLAIANLYSIDLDLFKIISFFVAIGLLFLQIFKKPHVFSVLFLWISFQLIFYSLAFHYHYSILAGLISLGVLLNIFSVKKFEIIPIILITIPGPAIFFHLTGDPAILPLEHYSIIALWSVFWLLVLDVTLIYNIFSQHNIALK